MRGYRKLKIPIMDSHGTSAWPEKFPPSGIDALRDSVGARHFSAQMMLEFVAPDRVRLDPGALHMYNDEFDARSARIGEHVISGLAAYWDPSSGRRKSDGSVCVLLYRDDRSRRIFVHDILYLTVSDDNLHPLASQCDKVLDFMSRHGLRRITVETNGIGNALPEIMRDVATRRGVNIYVHKCVNTKNKETRILDAIEPLLTSGRLYAHVRIQSSPLMSEMLGWSPLGGGVHDDGIDAVAGAIMSAPVTVRPLSRAMQSYSANTNFKI